MGEIFIVWGHLASTLLCLSSILTVRALPSGTLSPSIPVHLFWPLTSVLEQYLETSPPQGVENLSNWLCFQMSEFGVIIPPDDTELTSCLCLSEHGCHCSRGHGVILAAVVRRHHRPPHPPPPLHPPHGPLQRLHQVSFLLSAHHWGYASHHRRRPHRHT